MFKLPFLTDLRKLSYLTLAIHAPLIAAPETYTVTSLADTNSGTGTSGTLRYCINQANLNPGPNTIQFGIGGTIILAQSLPPMNPNIGTVTSNGQTVTINGGNLFQPFFALPGTSLTIGNNIAIVGGASIGGAGGNSSLGGGGGGGGALGAGGGLFVAPGAHVILQGVSFATCHVAGGDGGSQVAGVETSGAGGGGMSGGTGGSASALNSGGGGGGGYGGAGGAAFDLGGGGGGGLFFGGGNGAGGGGGGGGSDATAGSPGAGGDGGAGGTDLQGHTGGAGGATGPTGGAGGAGTFLSGGGGGGSSTGASTGGAGGASAMGAGGGGTSATGPGGAGAASSGSFGGGGGGARATMVGGSGGNGGNYAGGGGGGGGVTTGGEGGNGGFGGGGGGGGRPTPGFVNFGNGGFGGGGAGGYGPGSGLGSGAPGLFGGGDGGKSLPAMVGGGGGAALGGTIFVGSSATLTFQNPLQSTITSSASTAGSGNNGGGNGQALGPDFFVMSSGTLIFAQTSTFTIPSNIDSDLGAGGGSTTTGGIALNSATTLILSGTNTYTGSTTLNAGTVQISSDSNLGAAGTNVVFNAGTLSLLIPVNSSRGVVLNGTGTFEVPTGTSTWSGPFTGLGVLQTIGAGTLVLTGANTYSGGTNLLGTATVSIAAPGKLGTGTITFGNGVSTGTLELQAGFMAQTLTNNIQINSPGGTIHSLVVGPTSPILSGEITGSAGTLTLDLNSPGAGQLTLTGKNTFLGIVTQLNPMGTLHISGPQSLLFSNLVNNGSLIFDQTGQASVAGSITGTGSLTVQGPGNVVLTGNSSFTGPTTIQSAVLFVDGSSTSSPVTVQNGAALAGVGTVQNVNILGGGSVFPGDSAPGTLHGGNFTFNTGSTFVTFLSNTAAGQIASSGTFTIAPGAFLNIAPQGSVTPQVSHYTITTASSILGPEFTLTSPLPPFILEILYSSTSIELLVASPPFQDFLPHGNAKNTAVCLQTVMQQGNLTQLNKILDLQTTSQLQHSINQMQPANFDTIACAEENVGERIRQIFTAHFFEQRSVACKEKNGWRTWVAPFITHIHQKGEDLFSGYKEQFTGATVALDYHKKMWLFSGGFSYATSEMRMHQGKARAHFKSYAGTLGSAWSNGAWFMDLQFAYQYNPVQARRKMGFSVDVPAFSASLKSKARHRNRSNQVMGHFGGGYDIHVPAGRVGTFNFYPFTNVDYFYVCQAGYKETGAHNLNLKVYEKGYDYLRPEAGLGLGYHGCFQTTDVWFDISASYVLEFRLTGRESTVRFRKSPCHFHVNGLNPENNLICPEVSLKIASRTSGCALMLGFHGEYGDNFVEHSGQAEVRKSF